MADDDDDVRGEPGPEDLLSPPGPRRSNFTPPSADAESLEAAANIFNDDAIAAALAAELARVATGPIPIRVREPDPVPSPAAPSNVWQLDAERLEPQQSAPAETPITGGSDEGEADFGEPEIPEFDAPQPVAAAPHSEGTPPREEASVPYDDASVQSAPTAAPGPPDWASSLFGQPTPTVRDEQTPVFQDPFAPSSPSFAPPTGSFPPPSVADGSGGLPPLTTDPEELRALYRGAPAPTVPAADAPPPPGYEAPVATASVPSASAPSASVQSASAPSAPVPSTSVPSAPVPGDLRPRRRSLDDDDIVRNISDETGPVGTLDAIEQLQAQLHLREQEAREFAVWESSMQAIGTPEALAEIARARAELAGSPVVESAPTPPEPLPMPFEPAIEPDFRAAPPPVEGPDAFLPPPSEEPLSYLPAPTDEPAPFLPPPSEEPAAFLPPPVDEPASFLPPPVDEPASLLPPPVDEPVAFLPPPPDEPAAYVPPPAADEPAVDLPVPDRSPFATFAPPAGDASAQVWPLESTATSNEHSSDAAAPVWELPVADAPPPPADESPFAGFAPPTSDEPFDTFDAPADPRDLQFSPQPLVPDAPVFIEPPSFDAPTSDAPVFEPPVAPPPLIEPTEPIDGVAELYRAAGEVPPPIDVQSVPTTGPELSAGRIDAAGSSDAHPEVQSTQPPAAPPAEPISAPTSEPIGFEGLLAGLGEPSSPDPVWVQGDPIEPPASGPTEEPGDRRPFGEGVERDDAVDPSDSIFGPTSGIVSVNTAGVAIVPDYVVLQSQPIRVIETASTPTLLPPTEFVRPKVVPAEPIGPEPTPEEQRVGRSARLFWLWFAANSSIVSIVFGTIIFALGVSLRQAIVAALAGVALSFIPLGLGTLAGKRSGQPTMVISRATFGHVGNILPAILALFSRLIWAAALLWVLGKGVAEILVGAKLSDGFTGDQLTIIAMALGFVVAVVVAYFGYGLVAIVQLVVSIISGIAIIGFIALTARYVNFTTALTTSDGPWILVVTGAVLVFSFVGLAWANSSADVARYQRPGSSGAASMLWATFGAGLPSFVLIGYGAVLAASNLTLAENIAVDPLDSLGRLLPVWYPAPLLIATGLSLISGVVLSMYSGGFALQAAGLRIRRSLSTLVVGLLVVVIALLIDFSVTDVTQLLRDVSTTVAVPIAAWVGIFVVETMIRRRPLDSKSLLDRGGVYPDVRWFNVIALILISVVGYGFLSATMPALSWEGYAFSALGVPLRSELAQSDLGVFVALILGMLVALATGFRAVRRQEGSDSLAE